MKKLVLGAILGASLMISSSAFALTAMTDANMKSATGQAGVSIAIDNVKIEQYVGSTSYIDDSGAYDDQIGSVVIGEKHTIKNFLALTSAGDYETDFNTASNTSLADQANWVKASALSIDVGTCKVLTAGLNANLDVLLPALTAAGLTTEAQVVDYLTTVKGYTIDEANGAWEASQNGLANAQTVTGVVIGLPTLLISTRSDEYTVGVAMEDAINDGDDFIRIKKGTSTMAILSGTVEIAAH